MPLNLTSWTYRVRPGRRGAICCLAATLALTLLVHASAQAKPKPLSISSADMHGQTLALQGFARPPQRLRTKKRVRLRVTIATRDGEAVQRFTTRVRRSRRTGRWRFKFAVRNPGDYLITIRARDFRAFARRKVSIASNHPAGCWELSEAEKQSRKAGYELNPDANHWTPGTGGEPKRFDACHDASVAAWFLGDRATAKVFAKDGLREMECLTEEQLAEIKHQGNKSTTMYDIVQGNGPQYEEGPRARA